MIRLHKLIVIFAGLAIIIVVAMLFVVRHNEWLQYSSEDLLTKWQYADGSAAEINGAIKLDTNKKSSVYLKYDTPHNDSRSLCFRSHNIYFNVIADGECVYSFHPKLGGIYGSCYGDAIHTVEIPEGTEVIRLDVTSLKDDSWDGLYEIVFEDSAYYIHQNTLHYLLAFFICSITFFIGFMIFSISIFILRGHESMIESMCLGVITMLMTVWCHSQIRILHIIVSNPLLIRVMDYTALELIPIPVWIYVASFTKSSRKPIVAVNVTIAIINFLLSFILTCLNIADYADFLISTHIIIFSGIIFIVILVIDAVKKKRVRLKQIYYLIAAVAAISVCAVIDMLRFYVWHTNSTTTMSRIGLFLFVIILTVYEFRQLVEIRAAGKQAELMEKLAMEDPLTGIGSRTAFNTFENELRNRKEGKCIFVQFDVNNLKKVNDNFGHAEGDKFIKAAASIIQNCFGKYGHCYRIGGDEFFVILDGENPKKDFESGLAGFTGEQEKYNETSESPVPLFIAYGMAEYDCSDGRLEKAEQTADSRMYEKKKEMKVM